MDVVHKKEKRGGARKGAGRPTKADEDMVRGMSVGAIKKMFGSEQAGWDHIAEMAKESFPHLKLLYDYSYGKPKETVENIIVEQPLYPDEQTHKNHSGK